MAIHCDASNQGKEWEVRADGTIRNPDTEEILGRLPSKLAALLDAAPDLLAACKAAQPSRCAMREKPYCYDTDCGKCAFCLCAAAIAKAEGPASGQHGALCVCNTCMREADRKLDQEHERDWEINGPFHQEDW